jgi:TetR/AcrR family tetracycline transcriptional repressor
MSQPARRKPGPAPSLSRDQVVDAALEVMAEQGLSSVSFRNVAARLGVNPMALYTYVRDKDELLAGMYDRVMGELSLEDSDEPAVDQLVDYYVRARRLMMRNADLHRLARPTNLPGAALHTAERLCVLLAELGLDTMGIATMQVTLLQLTVGNALYWATVGATTDPTSHLVQAAGTIEALDADEYPYVRAVTRELLSSDPEQVFVDSIRSILKAAAP